MYISSIVFQKYNNQSVGLVIITGIYNFKSELENQPKFLTEQFAVTFLSERWIKQD